LIKTKNSFFPIDRKTVRGLRPPLSYSGSTKFDRPQKTQAFSGPLELRERPALYAIAISEGSVGGETQTI